MHDKLNRMKQGYESISIPDELNEMVNRAIASLEHFYYSYVRTSSKIYS